MTAPDPPALELIRCKRRGPEGAPCGQVLARRYPSGDVHPVVVGAFVDKYGKTTITCPVCAQRLRLPVFDEAVRTA